MPVKIGAIHDRKTLLTNDFESTKYLQVNCCGIFEDIAENSLTIRPYGRKDYQLIIISNGNAVIKYNGNDIILLNGEMLIIPPNERNEYRYSDPIDALWVHFSGTAVSDILESYQIKPFTKYTISDTGQFFFYVEKMIAEFQLKKTGYMNICNSYLLNILTLAKRRIDEHLSKDKISTLYNLSHVIEHMQTNFYCDIHISDYAKMCNLSTSRFAHLFADIYGISPYKYLLNIRLLQAKHMLVQTNIQISEIARSVGYEDSFYFSRLFKKNVGISPNCFRNSNPQNVD